uniref:Uncharacterized protein n=1 Tax=Caenorhabditis japonica TaxID=281687 RepID=A0A8R1HW46_CAEJA
MEEIFGYGESEPIQVSVEYIINLRTSTVFRAYVIYIDIISVLALLISVYTAHQLIKKQVFSRSITHLLVASLIYGLLHNISYTSIETWSLYRSFAYPNNASAMMFTSQECFVQHVFNSCVRFLFLAAELALNVDRIIVIMFRRFSQCYPSLRGEVLNFLAVVISFALGCILHLDGPRSGVMTTSCFRETDITINLETTNLTSYTVLAFGCALLDLSMMWHTWNDRKKSEYDLKSKYLKIEQHFSLLAVSLNSLVQLFVTTTYTISMYVLAKVSAQDPERGNANLLRWFYTTPYSTLLAPIILSLFINWIGRRRTRQISRVTRESITQDSYFNQLYTVWKIPSQP